MVYRVFSASLLAVFVLQPFKACFSELPVQSVVRDESWNVRAAMPGTILVSDFPSYRQVPRLALESMTSTDRSD